MSLVSGYPQNFHPGPMPEMYPYHQAAYPERPDPGPAYFQHWMFTNGAGEMQPMSPDQYCGQITEFQGLGPMQSFAQFNPETRVRVVKRRVSANKKERRRTLSINTAFADLRGCIPNVPSDTKLSKIKTLRLATSYIAYLMDILAKDDPNLTEGGFKAEITKKLESKEDRRKRELAELNNTLSGGDTKKGKGRTGWPQHVWAQELKQAE
ncbi:heart- and neural crest derivatives-expressed protein 2 [Lingula anatina]|uniref:Heart- and neural crest derivatives-expressed protein 2 n=1 Tax=Lingula anatina TaxID=7574 RepID=A0A1S3IY14_LINAN|nr:heart- and neural crest derivatives-expressed protein 2 [Lingula anatina]|eukprot:XP_013402923.1 heart- and neural crest derivatives-expressed protein 2 [Lingula anatina]